MNDCCNEYSRSQLLRAAGAEAGKGLPMIEDGMPTPAGTGLSRRSLLLRSAGLALAVYGANKLPLSAFDVGIAEASPTDRILVSVFLDGGIDAMSVLAPVGDPRYAKLRPELALKPTQGIRFSEDPRLRWHPAAAKLARLHTEGKVSVFPAIGYGGPDYSHFTSRHYWEIGEVQVGARTGWLGRYLDIVGDSANPLQGLSLDRALSPALATATNPVAAINRVDGFDLSTRVKDPLDGELFKSFEKFGTLGADSPGLAQLQDATQQTARLRTQLSGIGAPTSTVSYPSSTFASRLAGLASYISAGLPIRIATTRGAGGYDTHSRQTGLLGDNLRMTCDGLYAFQRDLEARGLADRVLINVWSEFGRRPQENGSAGTDHGAAGCAFVIGTKAAGKMTGEFPGLHKLDRNENLRHTSDFRSMYCSLLEQWLGQDAAAIIPGAGAYARPTLVKA